MGKEKPESKDAGDQDRDSKPCAVEKPIERPAIRINDTIDEIAGVTFHPGRLMASFAFPQNAGAHQRRERQRYKTGCENRHDDRDGEFTKNASEQSRNEYQRNK